MSSLTGKELVKLLRKRGWKVEHVRGSHHILRKAGKTVSIPVHAGKDLGTGLLARLLRDTGLIMKARKKGKRPPDMGWSGYFARVTKQRPAGYVAEFPDLPGCVTEGSTLEATLANAHEALSGWLYVALRHGDEVPPERTRRGPGYHRIVPDLDVRIPLAVLSARKRRGLSQQQVAKALGISQQAYRKLEVPGKSNPTLRTLKRLSEVLGLELSLRAA